MKKRNTLYLIIIFITMTSCYKEELVTPSKDAEKIISHLTMLEQGTKIHNALFTEYYETYGIISFYEFSNIDAFYYINSTLNQTYTPANENDIPPLYSLIDEAFFDLFDDVVLEKCLPLKLLFVSEIKYRDIITGVNSTWDSFYHYNSFIISGTSDVSTYDNARKKIFKDNVIRNFLIGSVESERMPSSNEFWIVSDYSKTNTTATTCFDYGFLHKDGDTTKEDLQMYIDLIVSKSTTEVEAFLTEKDKKGLIRRKYDILVAHFLTLDIDILKIANYEFE